MLSFQTLCLVYTGASPIQRPDARKQLSVLLSFLAAVENVFRRERLSKGNTILTRGTSLSLRQQTPDRADDTS